MALNWNDLYQTPSDYVRLWSRSTSKEGESDSLTGPEWWHAHLLLCQGERGLVKDKPKQLTIPLGPHGMEWGWFPKANRLLTSKREEEMAPLVAIHWNNSNYSLLACPLYPSLSLSFTWNHLPKPSILNNLVEVFYLAVPSFPSPLLKSMGKNKDNLH